MNTIVTGGAGFIGSHLVDALVKYGHRVFVIDDLSHGRKEYINKKAKFLKVDIRSKKILKIFKNAKPTAVFHLAAQMNLEKSKKDPGHDADVNILGSLNVIQAAQEAGVKKFTFASTAGVYGNTKQIPAPERTELRPPSPYGLAKLTGERYLEIISHARGSFRAASASRINYTILRFSNVYGPRQDSSGEGGVVAIFARQLARGQSVAINGSGRQTRDFIYVGDIVGACLKTLTLKKSGVYNVSTTQETSINDLFAVLLKISGKSVEPKHGRALPGEQKRSALDNRKIKTGLKWQPKVELEAGLKKTYQWFK